MTATARAIVVAHADLARGLVSAVAAITGRDDLFVPISNAGLDSAAITETLVAAVDEHRARVVFTDLPMGSCSMAAHRLLRERPDLIVVTGVNLPMLLYAATHEGDAPQQLADGALERARQALRAVTSEPMKPKADATPGRTAGAD
jgi:mannose/fructose-specific phosphotransferase system component IIA